MMPEIESFVVESSTAPKVSGFLHRPENSSGTAVVLAHGAGSNSTSPLLVVMCKALAEAGFLALRIDLPFRQVRKGGAPTPKIAVRDREGIRHAAQAVKALGVSKVILGGHSYGGRQSTMLAAEDSSVCDGLLLLSYPLHPPDKPEKLRTEHFSQLNTTSLFVHGSKDPFGTLDEMRQAIALIPGSATLLEVPGAGHDMRKAPLPKIVEFLLRL